MHVNVNVNVNVTSFAFFRRGFWEEEHNCRRREKYRIIKKLVLCVKGIAQKEKQ